MLGWILGTALWAVLFVPLATFGIQPKLDTLMIFEADTYAGSIALRFAGLYYIVIGASLLFHLIYGTIFGLIAARMSILRLRSQNVLVSNGLENKK